MSNVSLRDIPEKFFEKKDCCEKKAESIYAINQLEKPDSKVLYSIVIAIGLLVVASGLLGTLGLIHGLTLPPELHWLSSAISTIGHTPHHWGLWTLSIGGVSLGAGLVGWASSKVHKIRQDEKNQKYLRELRDTYIQLCEEKFSDCIQVTDDFGKKLDQPLSNGQYRMVSTKNKQIWAFKFQDAKGNEHFSIKFNIDEAKRIASYLKYKGYISDTPPPSKSKKSVWDWSP